MKAKKPIYKRWWFWALIVCMIIGLIMPDKEPAEAAPTISTEPATEAVTSPLPEATTEEPTEVVQTQFDEYIGSSLKSFMAAVELSDYTATYLADGIDFTDFISSLVDDYLVGGLTEDPDEKTVVVDLLLKTNSYHEEVEKELREKLEPFAAWVAVEEYCQAEHGVFELHYLTGKIEEYAEDESTWFLKAECTIGGIDKICEAKVTGTTDAPELVSLDVY